MSEEVTYRSYNDFSKQAIYNNSGDLTSHTDGWKDDYLGQDATSTPINADNLNAMLQMLIYIRNVIGKTDDFETKINSSIKNASKPDPSGTYSLATYLKDMVNAILGTDDDTAEFDTIKGAKKYTAEEIEDLKYLILEELGEINCGTAAEFIDDGGTN